ncbi:MAG TPA: biopolymer transporter ExbD [Chthoniobacterales bacterium]
MKLARSVRLEPHLIFLVALMDVVFLLGLLFVVSATFLLHSGVSVRLPYSSFILAPEKHALILTVTAGPYPTIFYRDQKVALKDLGEKLARDAGERATVIIRADRETPQGVVVQISNLCLERGLNVMLATSPKTE